MNVELRIPGADASGRVFLTWAPVAAQARLLNPTGTAAVPIVLRGAGPVGGLRFAKTRTHLGTRTLALSLPASGAPVRFLVAGEFGRPSINLGDATIEARAAAGTASGPARQEAASPSASARTPQTLSAAERDRFLAALRDAERRRRRPLPRLPRHARARGTTGAARERRLPALASRLPARPRARAAGDRPERGAALLAVRPTGAEPLHREFMGVPNAVGRRRSSAAGHPFGHLATDGALGIYAHAVVRAGSAAYRAPDRDADDRRSAARRQRRPTGPSTPWRATRTARRT